MPSTNLTGITSDGWGREFTFNNSAATFIAGQYAEGNDTVAWVVFTTPLDGSQAINEAILSLKAQATDADVLSLEVRGQLLATAQPPDGGWVDMNTKANSNLTTASVTWNISGVTADEVVQSPDLSSIVDEIRQLPSYDGSLLLWLHQGSTAGGSAIAFYSADSTGNEPSLALTYGEAESSSNVSLLDPSGLKPGMVSGANLKPGLVTASYSGGTPSAATDIKRGMLTDDGNLKRSLLGSNGNLKPGLLN